MIRFTPLLTILAATGTWLTGYGLQLLSALMAVISGAVASWYYAESAMLKRRERKRLDRHEKSE